tara:strand:- start:69 stop:266 length:198 start_codon:yes stop_codon:yes gene_type:complete
MSPDTLPKRVFFCLLIIIIFIGFLTTGCHSVNYEWLPESEKGNQKSQIKRDEDSKVHVNVVKLSF